MLKLVFLLRLAALVFSPLVFADSFQQVLLDKRPEVLASVGERRMRLLDEFAATHEIYRITEVLSVPGLSKKLVTSLGDILGYRFDYTPHLDICVKSKQC